MLGVIVGVLVAVLFLLLSVKVDTNAERPRTVLRNPGLLILGIGVTVFAAAFANRCFLTVPAAYVATVFSRPNCPKGFTSCCRGGKRSYGACRRRNTP